MVAMKTRWPEFPVWLGNTTLSLVRLNEKELKLGDKDAAPFGAVRMLQEAVRHWGLTRKSQPTDLFPKYGADGVYGSETVAAVKVFQRNNKDAFGAALADDGIVGDKTLSVLDRLVTPAKSPVPPVPGPVTKTLTIEVDFVVFHECGTSDDVVAMLEAANQVYKPIGIEVKQGDVILPSPQTRALASKLFCNNKTNGLPDPKKTSTVVRMATARQQFPVTDEARAMARRGKKKRPTAYVVSPFPAPESAKGATFTPTVHEVDNFFMLIVNDPLYKTEALWHELAHVMLDTGFYPNTKTPIEDHSIFTWENLKIGDPREKDWLLTCPPMEHRRKAYFPQNAATRMQETVRTKFM